MDLGRLNRFFDVNASSTEKKKTATEVPLSASPPCWLYWGLLAWPKTLSGSGLL